MPNLRVEVEGLPAPQGSKTAVMIGGKARLIDGSTSKGRAGHKAWRSAVHEAAAKVAREAPECPLDEPVSVSVVFRLPLPDSDRHRTRHATTPDVDKLLRSTMDALVTAGVLHDDSRIYAIQGVKVYARRTPAGATIDIGRHGDSERADRQRSVEAAALARKEARRPRDVSTPSPLQGKESRDSATEANPNPHPPGPGPDAPGSVDAGAPT